MQDGFQTVDFDRLDPMGITAMAAADAHAFLRAVSAQRDADGRVTGGHLVKVHQRLGDG
jgi:hypothetical protein